MRARRVLPLAASLAALGCREPERPPAPPPAPTSCRQGPEVQIQVGPPDQETEGRPAAFTGTARIIPFDGSAVCAAPPRGVSWSWGDGSGEVLCAGPACERHCRRGPGSWECPLDRAHAYARDGRHTATVEVSAASGSGETLGSATVQVTAWAPGPPPVTYRLPSVAVGPGEIARRLRAARARGRPALLLVYQTSCTPCEATFPEVNRIARRFGPRGLEVLAFSLDSDRRALEAYLRPAPLFVAPLRLQGSTRAIASALRSVGVDYGGEVPIVAAFDAGGRLAWQRATGLGPGALDPLVRMVMPTP